MLIIHSLLIHHPDWETPITYLSARKSKQLIRKLPHDSRPCHQSNILCGRIDTAHTFSNRNKLNPDHHSSLINLRWRFKVQIRSVKENKPQVCQPRDRLLRRIKLTSTPCSPSTLSLLSARRVVLGMIQDNQTLSGSCLTTTTQLSSVNRENIFSKPATRSHS